MSLKKICLFAILLLIAPPFVYFSFFSGGVRTVVKGMVYRSSQPSGELLEKTIIEKGVRTVLNLRGKFEESRWYIREREICQKYNVALHEARLSPQNLPSYRDVLKILKILSTAEYPILLHCVRGADRSGFASALALLVIQDPPLQELRKQFSWRYGVLPFYGSIGPNFFSKYDQWLKKENKRHKRSTFIEWVTQHYVDRQGNIEFCIDSINGRPVGKDVRIHRDTKEIVLEGWAFNARTRLPPEGFYVALGPRNIGKPHFGTNRPDVARFFELGEKDDDHFIVGWKLTYHRTLLAEGCHPISLKIVANESESLEVPTSFSFCLEDPLIGK